MQHILPGQSLDSLNIHPVSLNYPVCVHLLLAERFAEHGVSGFNGQSSNLGNTLGALCVGFFLALFHEQPAYKCLQSVTKYICDIPIHHGQ